MNSVFWHLWGCTLLRVDSEPFMIGIPALGTNDGLWLFSEVWRG